MQSHPRDELIVNKDLYPLDWHPHTFNIGQFSEIGVRRPWALQSFPLGDRPGL